MSKGGIVHSEKFCSNKRTVNRKTLGIEVGTACSSDADEAGVVEGVIEDTVRENHGQIIYGQLEKNIAIFQVRNGGSLN